MIQSLCDARVVFGLRAWALVAALGTLFSVRVASAQTPSGAEGVAVGEWWFRPLLQLRTRGEYWSNPAEVPSGETAVLARVPATLPPLSREWLVHERSRLGLSVDKGPLSAALVIQDARLWGTPSPTLVDRTGDVATTRIHTAFFDVHTAELRRRSCASVARK